MDNQQYKDRDNEIYLKQEAGESLRLIAKQYNISYTRCLQICDRERRTREYKKVTDAIIVDIANNKPVNEIVLSRDVKIGRVEYIMNIIKFNAIKFDITNIPQLIYDVAVKDIGVGWEIYASLYRGGITNIGQILDIYKTGDIGTIENVRNVGKMSIIELETKLDEFLHEHEISGITVSKMKGMGQHNEDTMREW